MVFNYGDVVALHRVTASLVAARHFYSLNAKLYCALGLVILFTVGFLVYLLKLSLLLYTGKISTTNPALKHKIKLSDSPIECVSLNMAQSTRSALMKVMINRYMKRHGIKDAPDQSTPGYFTEEVCGHPCGDQAFRVSPFFAVILASLGWACTNLWVLNCVIFGWSRVSYALTIE